MTKKEQTVQTIIEHFYSQSYTDISVYYGQCGLLDFNGNPYPHGWHCEMASLTEHGSMKWHHRYLGKSVEQVKQRYEGKQLYSYKGVSRE